MLKTGIVLNHFGLDCTDDDALALIKNAGFDTFFTGFRDEATVDGIKNSAEKLGLVYESIHAPFGGINCMWDAGDEGDEYVKNLTRVADACKNFGIPYFTLHCMCVPKFNDTDSKPLKWSKIGLDRFKRVAEHAEKLGVKACFENVEFPHNEMAMLLDALTAEKIESVGFTYDAGHEHCYPSNGMDILDKFGHLLVGTHMHDNFGQSDKDVVTWNDDSHIMIFDGTVNFKRIGEKLKDIGYTGSITLEMGKKDTVPWYNDMTAEEFLDIAHSRALHIARWCE